MGCFRVRRKPFHSTSIRPFPGRAVPSRPRGDDGRPRAGVPSRDSSMPNKMLIDATHPEETRVVVLRGNRVEEFDFESANRKQLRGNIYLAKVTRVEPSLQAAFVDYGGNRHGFLAFSEIHPDYYQIPVADRQALLREEAEAVAEEARREANETDSHPEHDNHDDESDGSESGPTEIEEAGGGSVPWDIEDPVPTPLTNETPEADPSGAIAAERSAPT